MKMEAKKLGIIPCCGSECAGGLLTRIAAGKIIYEVPSAQVETISLPRLLIGTMEEKQFTRTHATITLDGCHKACAQKAVEKYSGKVTLPINVEDIIGCAIAGKESLPIEEFTTEHAAAIRKVTGVIDYVIDTMSNMGKNRKQGCGTVCDCGCGGSSGCGCGGEEHDHHHPVQPVKASMGIDSKGISIYTKTGCPFCAKTVLEYKEKGIDFREINISLDPRAKQLCRETYGIDRVPIIVKDGVVVQIGDTDGKG